MSKEQAMRFMLLTEVDEDLKQKYQGIVNKYEGKNLIKKEQEKIILEEVIPLAKSKGYDFSLGDFQELLQPAKKQLTDEELDKAVGGRGQFTEIRYIAGLMISSTYSCEYAPDDETFRTRFYSGYNINCPDYEFCGYGPNIGDCPGCRHSF